MYTNDPHPKPKTKRRFKTRLFFILMILLLFGTAAFAVVQTLALQQLKANPQQVSQQEADGIVAEVGKHLSLPNERPTIATVEDATKLKDQSFFKDAKNGDRVLIYTQAKRAYLYRPSESRVIEVAALNIK